MSGAIWRPTAATGACPATVVPGNYGVGLRPAPVQHRGSVRTGRPRWRPGIFNACLNGPLMQPVADGAAHRASPGLERRHRPERDGDGQLRHREHRHPGTPRIWSASFQATGGVTSPERPAKLRRREGGWGHRPRARSPSPPSEPGVRWNADRDPAIAGRRSNLGAIAYTFINPASSRRTATAPGKSRCRFPTTTGG